MTFFLIGDGTFETVEFRQIVQICSWYLAIKDVRKLREKVEYISSPLQILITPQRLYKVMKFLNKFKNILN